MSSTAPRPSALEADEVFVALVETARDNDWTGTEATQLMTVVLPGMTRSLSAEFPSLEPNDILTRAWQIVNRPGLSAKRFARTWVVKSLRRKLISVARAQRDHTSESTVTASGWLQERESFRIGPDERLVITGDAADEYLAAMPAAPSRPGLTVWDDLIGLLTKLRWPEDVAREAVEILEGQAELATGSVSIAGTSTALKCLPKGYRMRLARFVFARNGYLWARLHGVDDGRALRLADQEELLALVWNGTPQSRSVTFGPSAQTRRAS